jgi:ABC-type iron transport system FetAB permease component
MNYKSTAIISTILLIGFLVPYIWKIKEVPLLILLVVGVALAIYDFVLNTKAKPNLQKQHASYEEEST